MASDGSSGSGSAQWGGGGGGAPRHPPPIGGAGAPIQLPKSWKVWLQLVRRGQEEMAARIARQRKSNEYKLCCMDSVMTAWPRLLGIVVAMDTKGAPDKVGLCRR